MFVWVIKIIQLHKIEDSKEIIFKKTDKSKECEICHYNYFNNGFKSHSKVCNDCDWGIKSFTNFAIITANGVWYRVYMFDMTEEEVIEFIKYFEANELQKCCSMKKLVFQKELALIKQMNQKNACFAIIGILTMLDLNSNQMFVINAICIDDVLWIKKHC